MSAINLVVQLPLGHGELPPHNERPNVPRHECTEDHEAWHLGTLTPRQPVLPQGHVGIRSKRL